MTFARPLWLASGSARRRQLLREARLAFEVCLPHVDDGSLHPGGTAPEPWAMAMAYLKARSVAETLRRRGEGGTVIAADTVCAVDGEVLGQPRDASHAAAMLMRFREREHRTISGVCLLDGASLARTLLVDLAVVRVGALSDEQIETYVGSGQWRGKAGGYNLHERLAEGWPIEVQGDPTSVIGLPMRRLSRLLGIAYPDG